MAPGSQAEQGAGRIGSHLDIFLEQASYQRLRLRILEATDDPGVTVRELQDPNVILLEREPLRGRYIPSIQNLRRKEQDRCDQWTNSEKETLGEDPETLAAVPKRRHTHDYLRH